jgi:hypothetical protein
MRDEEIIELEEKMHPYSKPKQVYKLRATDFIPIVGLKNHVKRCGTELSNPEISFDDYAPKCFIRDFALTLYNMSIVCCAGYGIERLVNLFSK